MKKVVLGTVIMEQVSQGKESVKNLLIDNPELMSELKVKEVIE